jgi:hypothetical protein
VLPPSSFERYSARVGAAHQQLHRATVERADGTAHACADIERILIDIIGLGQRFDDVSGDLRDTVRIRSVFQHDRKFVTTQAAT